MKFNYMLGDTVIYNGHLFMIIWFNAGYYYDIAPLLGGHIQRVYEDDFKLVTMALPDIKENRERCSKCGTTFYAGFDCTPCNV